MKHIRYVFIFLIPYVMFSQNSTNLSKKENNAAVENWIKKLKEKGIEVKNDSLYISSEYKRALYDKRYRTMIYPEEYSWEAVAALVKTKRLKPAFWYIINLYDASPKNKELSVKFLIMYDRLFPMDEILVSTFYTYSFMDPETSIIVNGKPETTRPDILENKLNNVNKMVNTILKYREQNSKK